MTFQGIAIGVFAATFWTGLLQRPAAAQANVKHPEVVAAVVEYLCETGSSSCSTWQQNAEHVVDPTR